MVYYYNILNPSQIEHNMKHNTEKFAWICTFRINFLPQRHNSVKYQYHIKVKKLLNAYLYDTNYVKK